MLQRWCSMELCRTQFHVAAQIGLKVGTGRKATKAEGEQQPAAREGTTTGIQVDLLADLRQNFVSKAGRSVS